MERENAAKQTLDQLHERRKQVVKLHKKGIKIMNIVAMTGLSYPCVRSVVDPLCSRRLACHSSSLQRPRQRRWSGAQPGPRAGHPESDHPEQARAAEDGLLLAGPSQQTGQGLGSRARLEN